MTVAYRTTTVPVAGGRLAVGIWGPEDAPAVLAIHGVTASHMAWITVAEALPELRIIAPDLRGRGRSNALPGPWGTVAHAEDMKAVLDFFSLDPALVLGHSMGAFVAATLGAQHPGTVAALVLVDGGLPIPVPPGISADDAARAIIASAVERLSMTFTSRESYRDFWRKHPAFIDEWGPAIAAFADYDLDGEVPRLTPSASPEAVAWDSRTLSSDAGYVDQLTELAMSATFVRAPRGLLNEPRALYPESVIEEWKARIPELVIREVDDVNHYTIVMAPRGAEEVAAVVRDVRAGSSMA